MNTREAKNDLKKHLEAAHLPYTKLTAKTVSFSDLARARPVFVTVHGVRQWTREQWNAFNEVRSARRGYGYVVETSQD